MLGSNRMKKIAFVLAAAGLMSLAACNKPAETTATQNEADAMAANLDAGANTIDAVADNTSNAAAADVMSNTADNVHDIADDVKAAGENK
jgi:hypothetical protein